MPDSSLTPRRTPHQQRARLTHDAILEAAAHILRQHGLKAFNTNATAAKAGVSIGTLYQYFPNKDALMLALIEQHHARMLESIRMAVDSARGADLATSIRLFIQAVMKQTRADELLARVIDHEEARLPIDDVLNKQLSRGGDLVERLLRQAHDTPAGLDYSSASRTIPTIIRSVIDEWSNRAPAMLDIAEEEALTAVLGYVTHQPRTQPRGVD